MYMYIVNSSTVTVDEYRYMNIMTYSNTQEMTDQPIIIEMAICL